MPQKPVAVPYKLISAYLKGTRLKQAKSFLQDSDVIHYSSRFVAVFQSSCRNERIRHRCRIAIAIQMAMKGFVMATRAAAAAAKAKAKAKAKVEAVQQR